MKQKRTIAELAIFGGTPLFDRALHVGRPNVADPDGFMSLVQGILDRQWLTNDGPLVRELEQRVADLVGVEHCIAVCNATLGLDLLLRACELQGEVVVPSFTFIATPHAVHMAGLTPVFGDIDQASHCLDPHAVESKISDRTSAILGVHLWGRPCSVDALARLAERHDLTLLFDAAHAFGCSHQQRMIGRFGRAEVFSFHATKFVNSFEGGAIVTDDGELAECLRRMRNFGFVGYDDVQWVGTNAKMSEVAAAMALTNMQAIGRIIDTNRANYECYLEHLADLPGFRLLPYDGAERNNFQYVVVEVDEKAVGLSRDMVLQILSAENVLARRYFFPGCHLMKPYRELYPACRTLPVTEKVARRVLQLPTGMAIDRREIDAIGMLLLLIVENAAALRRGLRDQPRDISRDISRGISRDIVAMEETGDGS